jgi:hypothetical protein
MTRPPIRIALLIPLLSLGLLAPTLGLSQTQADTLPASCGLADVMHAAPAEDDVLLLSAMLSAEIDPVPAAPRRPNQTAPSPPGEVRSTRPPGADLRPPDQALLNVEPILAARQLRESLSDQQKADVQRVVAKHRNDLQRIRARLPELNTEAQASRPVRADQDAQLSQVASEVTRLGDQIEQEIESILTPQQRALLQKARPKRPRAELPLPETPLILVAAKTPGC